MKKAGIVVLVFFVCQFCHAQNWQTIPAGVPDLSMRILYTDTVDNLLYGGGGFMTIGTDSSYRGIAAYNGLQWDSLEGGMDKSNSGSFPNNTLTIARYNNIIYAGGAFSQAGNIQSKYLAQWNGFSWASIPGGQPNGPVDYLLVDNGELYACGAFDTIGGISANNIAKWNGANWSPVGNNFDFSPPLSGNTILRMCFYNGELFVSGSFEDSNSTPYRFAKWNGSTLIFLNLIQGGLDNIQDMIVYQGELYVAGLFYTNTGNAGNSIMKWNGTSWSDVGGGIGGTTNPYPTICDMTIHNNELYCVGNFETAGGVPASHIAKWNGTDWCGFGSTFDNTVSSIAFYNDSMYIGGGFWNIDSAPMSRMAQWIGGTYIDTCGNTTGIINPSATQQEVSVYPNPATETATFQFTGITGKAMLHIYDALGREVWQEQTSGSKVIIKTIGHSAGLYFYRLEQGGEIKTSGKLILQ